MTLKLIKVDERLWAVRTIEDKDEDMESRGSGFVVLYDVSRACKSCLGWGFGGGHASEWRCAWEACRRPSDAHKGDTVLSSRVYVPVVKGRRLRRL